MSIRLHLLLSIAFAISCPSCHPRHAEPADSREAPAQPEPAQPAAPSEPPPAPSPSAAAAAPTDAWYEAEIRAFEASDRASRPAPGMILFVGSSSIRMWETLERDMAPAPVLNRGFGGSKTSEVLAVFDCVVLPYEPRVIVYYCGDNDLGTENKDAAGAAEGFLAFERRSRAEWPGVRVFFIAIKPSLARWSNWESMREANEIVRAYCERTPRATFLDIATPMLGADGKPDPTLFKSDGLHLNGKGYEVWTRVVRGPVVEAWEQGK